MEALIPKLFIITAEASLVLFLILLVIIVFNSKAKRKDLKAANQLISQYVDNKEERLATIKSRLKNIAFSGNSDEQAEKLYQQEKSLLKDFVNIYLRRDTYRLLDYPDNIMEVDDQFLKTSGSKTESAGITNVEVTHNEDLSSDDSRSEATANATIIAREQAESNEAHLKELSELRLKNTELNEHLFEALETITTLMTEHGKKTGQEVESNAQKLLEAIIYLRNNRLDSDVDPSQLAPSPDDGHDQVADPWSVNLANNDGTLDDSTAVILGINDELTTDLDSLGEEAEVKAETTDAKAQTETAAATTDESDPWADALAEQAATEPQDDTSEPAAPAPAEEADPWADALAEQAATEPQDDTSEPAPAAEETDPWADALAEQASSETESSSEDDPWAAALAEQEKSEKK